MHKCKGDDLYLAPHPPLLKGDGLFLKHGNCLLMGKNSPFKNIRVFKLQVISRGDYINTKEYHGEIPLYNHQLKTRDKIDLFYNCSEGR